MAVDTTLTQTSVRTEVGNGYVRSEKQGRDEEERQGISELLKEKKAQIMEKLKSGETQEAIPTGGGAYTKEEWDRLIQRMDSQIEEIRQSVREKSAEAAKESEETADAKAGGDISASAPPVNYEQPSASASPVNYAERLKLRIRPSDAVLDRLCGELAAAPKNDYFKNAVNGMVEYKGAFFVCDYATDTLQFGDCSDRSKCIGVALSGGGSLLFNRDDVDALSGVISMFSAEDIGRILAAIQADRMREHAEEELEETKNGESSGRDMVN